MVNYEKSRKLHNDYKMEDINDNLMGRFATYLGNHATKGCDPNKPLLAYLTAYGYMSALKNWFCMKYKDDKIPSVFEKDKWLKYLTAIYKVKSQQARQLGQVCEKLNFKMLICAYRQNIVYIAYRQKQDF